MPCYDARDEVERETKEKEMLKQLNLLQERNDQLMRVLCYIDRSFQDREAWEEFLCGAIPEVRFVILEHRQADEKRWYEQYKTKFPLLTKQEIAKIVRSGILED